MLHVSSSLSENYQTGLDMGASKIGVTSVPHWIWGYHKIVISQKVFQGHSYHSHLPTGIDHIVCNVGASATEYYGYYDYLHFLGLVCTTGSCEIHLYLPFPFFLNSLTHFMSLILIVEVMSARGCIKCQTYKITVCTRKPTVAGLVETFSEPKYRCHHVNSYYQAN